ncbi:hypothetical protein [Maritimibacter sp. HL-12]|uniref:hypothetical protein n=1 Tax=Maritimibacter sp. HL-12 TaxID=1162418 RepID=UPI00159483F3|nr:hypothetical protein [Maritimibacter sp. HL-12]
MRRDLIRTGGEGLEHVEALLLLRGVRLPKAFVPDGPIAKNGQMKKMVLDALRDGGKTRRELVDHIAALRPDVSPECAYWRTDAALSALRAKGLVSHEGRVWALQFKV